MDKFHKIIRKARCRINNTPTIEERFRIISDEKQLSSIPENGQRLFLGNDRIDDLKLLGISKAGRLSWQAKIGEDQFKIYQSFSEKQAKFIKNISELPKFSLFFPQVYCQHKEYLVVKWIKGEQVNERIVNKSPNIIEDIAKLQVGFHKSDITKNSVNSGFDYINHLKSRLSKYLGPIKVPKNIQRLLDMVGECDVQHNVKISHADVTLKNLIVDSNTHTVKLIDNEYLSFNNYYLIDVFNTYRSLRDYKKYRNKYLCAYHEFGGNLSPIIDNSQFFQSLWALRILVTLIQAGYINRATRLAEEMFNTKFKIHSLITEIGDIAR